MSSAGGLIQLLRSKGSHHRNTFTINSQDANVEKGEMKKEEGGMENIVWEEEDEVGNVDEKVGEEDDKVGEEEDKAGEEDEKVGEEDDKVGAEDDKVGEEDDKVGAEDDKVREEDDQPKDLRSCKEIKGGKEEDGAPRILMGRRKSKILILIPKIRRKSKSYHGQSTSKYMRKLSSTIKEGSV